MASICIVTSGHFCTNPRVWREADALSAAGHEVTVVGVRFDAGQAEIEEQMLRSRCWTYRPAADLRRHSLASWHNWQRSRVRSRWGRLLLSWDIQDAHALGYSVDKLLSAALKQKAELTIVHLQPAMWVGVELQKRGHRVGVDMEDWYSESAPDTSVNQKRLRYYRQLESQILQRAAYVTTTSRVLADALHNSHRCRRPEVIYNSVPSVRSHPLTHDGGAIRLIWFSQTLGQDRGLQDIFAALPLLDGEWVLELRANVSPGMRNWVESQVAPPLRNRVEIQPTVSPDDLTPLIATFDVGLCLEQPWCRNKALTVSNKMFHYLQCGLLVAASDTPGQNEILDALPLGGLRYPHGNAVALASVINHWIEGRAQLAERKRMIFQEANQRFAYERQAERLLNSVHRALEN